MDAVSAEVLMELNPKKKNKEWADKSISEIRQLWKRYEDPMVMKENKDLLFDRENVDYIRAQYKDKDFLKTVKITPLSLLAPIINTLDEEIAKDPPQAEFKPTDPAALSALKEDLGKLKNRKIIEGDISTLNKQIGLPPYKLDYKKNFKSNIEDFDEMGLDENDNDDINLFKKYHRLWSAIGGQSLVNNVMSLNRFDEEDLRKMVIDIIAVKKIAIQVYVDKTTGEIKYKYLYPETVWGIWGDSYDGHDDDARGWEENISMSTFLQMAGNDFDFERDWKKLLASINMANAQKYTGFRKGLVDYNCKLNPEDAVFAGIVGVTDNLLNWEDGYRLKVSIGFVEWKTWEATSTNLIRKEGRSFVDTVSFEHEVSSTDEVKGYEKESKYQQQWYSSYFLNTGTGTQLLYNFSKNYYQQLSGANDEYSAGTMVCYREPGNSAIDMIKTDKPMINSVFYKMLYLIYHAKPADQVFVLEELIAQAKAMKSAFPEAKDSQKSLDSILENIIAMQVATPVKLRSYPQIDGRTVAQLPPLEGKRNGLDPVAISMQAILEWGENRLIRRILGNGMRLGMNPPSRESEKSEQNTVDSSQNLTGYIYRMCQYLKQKVATITMNYAQDIIKFKDTLPYNYLLKLVGNERFDSIAMLDDFAAHRYGIFFKDYNTDISKADLRQAAFASLQQKEIDYGEYFLVTQTQDVKAATQQFELAKYKNEKKLRQQQVQDMQAQQQAAMAVQDAAMKVAEFERTTVMMKADLEAKALLAGKKIEADSKAQVKGMTIQSDPSKIAAQTQGKQDVEVTKANLERSQPFET